MYVIDIDTAENTIVIGPEDHLLASELHAAQATFIDGVALRGVPMRVSAKVRYKSPEAPALLIPDKDSDGFTLQFDDPQRAVTPGQAVVLYNGGRMLGGGVIQRSVAAEEVHGLPTSRAGGVKSNSGSRGNNVHHCLVTWFA